MSFNASKPARRLALAVTLAVGSSGAASAQYYAPPQPGGPDSGELNAAAREMASRTRVLADAIAADYGRTAEGQEIARDARALSDTVEAISRSLDYRPDPEAALAAYREVDGLWHHLEEMFAGGGGTPGVGRAMRRVAEADHWMHRTLGLGPAGGIAAGGPAPIGEGFDPFAGRQPPPPVVVERRTTLRPAFDPAAAALPHAEQLMVEADAFLVRFSVASFKVPEREGFFADVSRLRNESAALVEDLRRGAPADILAARVEGLNLSWIVLEQRLTRVGRGRPGPNIASLLDMGTTVGRIAGALEPILGAPAEMPPAAFPGNFGPR